MRREREKKEIGLREMAKMIGVSPTYLSMVERDVFAPPAEDKVRAIAQVIGCDVDELLGRADRVASDLSEIIKRHPVELGSFASDHQGSDQRGHRPVGPHLAKRAKDRIAKRTKGR